MPYLQHLLAHSSTYLAKIACKITANISIVQTKSAPKCFFLQFGRIKSSILKSFQSLVSIASHPMSISLYACRKSPVYQGSATSR